MRTTRPRRALALGALLAATSCNGLREDPGHDFEVRVLDAQPIPAVGQIAATVHFAVRGCESFSLSVQNESGTKHPLRFSSSGDGTYQTSLPVVWLRPEVGMCEFFISRTRKASLVATCSDVGRSTRAGLTVLEQTATRAVDVGRPVRAIFPSNDPLRPHLVSLSNFGNAVDLGSAPYLEGEFAPSLDWNAAAADPLIRPRLVSMGSRAFVTLGCAPGVPCPEVALSPSTSVPGERLADVALTDAFTAPPRGLAHVPAHVVDMAWTGDGALVVVSQVGDPGRGYAPVATIVSRVLPAPEGTSGVAENAVSVIATFPLEQVQTRLSRSATGKLVFAALAFPEVAGAGALPIALVLHETDGSTVGTTTGLAGPVDFGWMTAAGARLGAVDLAPDASSMVVSDEEPSAPALLVPTDPGAPVTSEMDLGASSDRPPNPYPGPRNGGTAWLQDAVALWRGASSLNLDPSTAVGSEVQVFERSAPHTLRFVERVPELPGAVLEPTLLDVIGVGDKLVLTTSTGIRILGPDGALVGGADPLPCALGTTAPAVRTGPNTVALGAWNYLYVFDLSQP